MHRTRRVTGTDFYALDELQAVLLSYSGTFRKPGNSIVVSDGNCARTLLISLCHNLCRAGATVRMRRVRVQVDNVFHYGEDIICLPLSKSIKQPARIEDAKLASGASFVPAP